MKKAPFSPFNTPNLAANRDVDLRAVIAGLQDQIQSKDQLILSSEQRLKQREEELKEALRRIEYLEEINRLYRAQKFGRSSEKNSYQMGLFDEVEVEAALDDLLDQGVESGDEGEVVAELRQAQRKSRNRAIPPELPRKRIEFLLTEAQKRGASAVFFKKVKEELELVPAQMFVREYWLETAVFDAEDSSKIITAERPLHPLKKCTAAIGLLTWIIDSKYRYGLPLHRLEAMTRQLGHEVSRGTMAQWVIAVAGVITPLVKRLRAIQNQGDYLQADETRIQVLKEAQKSPHADKWMWVTRGGPPRQQSVLFEYDPSRSGEVMQRLLDGFAGVLQADGYSGYTKVCREQKLTRIGCWDHARRKFVEAARAGKSTSQKGSKYRGKLSAADLAVSKIRKLYEIERGIADQPDHERLKVRQEVSLPYLATLNEWLLQQQRIAAKGGKYRAAVDYTLNQWTYLVGYCERGDLDISNVLAENAIRPFAVGRRAWLFADSRRGASASAICYSLIETAKLNGLDSSQYLRHVLERVADADTPEKLDALLPWNVEI